MADLTAIPMGIPWDSVSPIPMHTSTTHADYVALPAFARRAAVRRAAIDRYLLPAAPQLQSLRTERQADRRTDGPQTDA